MRLPGGSDGKESACNAGDWLWSLGQEDPLEQEMATHSSILTWRIPWTEKPGRLQSMGSQTDTTKQLTLSLFLTPNIKIFWNLGYTYICVCIYIFTVNIKAIFRLFWFFILILKTWIWKWWFNVRKSLIFLARPLLLFMFVVLLSACNFFICELLVLWCSWDSRILGAHL